MRRDCGVNMEGFEQTLRTREQVRGRLRAGPYTHRDYGVVTSTSSMNSLFP